jgi:hypothetical protein
LVLLLVKNAPPTTVVALILNVAGEAEFVATDGLAVVGVPNVQAGRVAWLYAVTSVQLLCEAIVLPAAGLLVAPDPYKPKYQVVI